MKDTSKLLPIGSVVLLNDGTKKIMVTGFYAVPADDNSKVYDYCGCLFPEGIVSSEQNLLFDHSQIAKVFYMGYASEEEKEFKNKLAEIINNQSKAQVETPAAEAVVPSIEPVSNDVVAPSVEQTPVENPVPVQTPTPEVIVPVVEGQDSVAN